MSSVAVRFVRYCIFVMGDGQLPLCPQVEGEIGDIRVQLGRQFQESLQDVPRTDGCSVSGVRRVGVD